MLQEKDALSTGDQVRKLMDRLLLTKPWDSRVLWHYAAGLELLTQETSNHEFLLAKPYVQQLVLLATQLKGEGLALALRGLRQMAQVNLPHSACRLARNPTAPGSLQSLAFGCSTVRQG